MRCYPYPTIVNGVLAPGKCFGPLEFTLENLFGPRAFHALVNLTISPHAYRQLASSFQGYNLREYRTLETILVRFDNGSSCSKMRHLRRSFSSPLLIYTRSRCPRDETT